MIGDQLVIPSANLNLRVPPEAARTLDRTTRARVPVGIARRAHPRFAQTRRATISRMSRLASCLLIILVGQTVSAQNRPDFSGDWVLVRRGGVPLNAAQSITVHESFKRESVRGAPVNPPLITLMVERRINGIVHSELSAERLAAQCSGTRASKRVSRQVGTAISSLSR
jgi:hypothetical protein